MVEHIFYSEEFLYKLLSRRAITSKNLHPNDCESHYISTTYLLRVMYFIGYIFCQAENRKDLTCHGWLTDSKDYLYHFIILSLLSMNIILTGNTSVRAWYKIVGRPDSVLVIPNTINGWIDWIRLLLLSMLEMSSFHVVSFHPHPSPHAPHKALCDLKAVHSSPEHLPISLMQIPTFTRIAPIEKQYNYCTPNPIRMGSRSLHASHPTTTHYCNRTSIHNAL